MCRQTLHLEEEEWCVLVRPDSIWARPAQLAELSRSKFDPELLSHSAYEKFFVTFAKKVPFLTFCDKIWQFFIYEMDRGR